MTNVDNTEKLEFNNGYIIIKMGGEFKNHVPIEEFLGYSRIDKKPIYKIAKDSLLNVKTLKDLKNFLGECVEIIKET